VVTTDLVTPVTVARNAQRVAINFAAVNGTFSAAHTIQLSVNGVAAFQLDSVVHYFYCSLTDFGLMPTYDWSILGTGAGRDMSITEWFMPEKYLAIALQEFNSKYNF